MLRELIEKKNDIKVVFDGCSAKGTASINGQKIEFEFIPSSELFNLQVEALHPFMSIELKGAINRKENEKAEFDDPINAYIYNETSKADVHSLYCIEGNMPVIRKKAVDYYKKNSIDVAALYCDKLEKDATKLGCKKAQKVLEKILIGLIKKFYNKEVEGVLFFDKDQQSLKSQYRKKLKILGLNIDTETKSVIEFSGNVLDPSEVQDLVYELRNCSYVDIK